MGHTVHRDALVDGLDLGFGDTEPRLGMESIAVCTDSRQFVNYKGER
jgi:hypothetical protein